MSAAALPGSAGLLLRCALQRPDPCSSLSAAAGLWQAPPLDPAHLQRFNKALGFETGALPLSYHYLAVQRAQLAWMLQPGFPHRLLGMVHMAQTLERLAPWEREAGFELAVSARAEANNLLLQAEVRQHDQPVLGALSVYRPLRERRSTRRPARERAVEAPPAGPPLARWTLSASSGRTYARLSGDANPIHLGRWGARLFGMQAPIIHGAHTLARCEAEVGTDAQRLVMRFLRPITLPGEALLYRAGEGDSYAVWSSAGRCAELQLS